MRNLIKYAEYFWERSYPYVGAFVVTFVVWKTNWNITEDIGYADLLNGLITLDSIIIGFLGAILPVVLSMKNESKFVKYVFQKDKGDLFFKYMKATVFWGLFNVTISLLLHVKYSFKPEEMNTLYYVWLFATIIFLLSTYRSMSHMITLVFSKDDLLVDLSDDNSGLSRERTREIKEKYRKKNR